MISCFPPDTPYVLYSIKERRDDNRDQLASGRDFDFSRKFFEQYHELNLAAPQIALINSFNAVNCDYANYGFSSKDCYMCYSPAFAEQCYYCELPGWCYYDIDGTLNQHNDYCYMCYYANKCYQCQYAIYSNNCKYCSYVLDCDNCQHCFGCVNLKHAKYCIWNKQYSKSDYFATIKELQVRSSAEELHDQFYTFSLQHPRRATRNS